MERNGVLVPRPAATVIAARHGSVGVEVLVLLRGAESRFLPGHVVFPGGGVEPEDADLAERWFGSAAETARACAVRELIEEAGLVLTAAGLAEARSEPLTAVSAAPPDAGSLCEISHWVAPADVPVRFDTRFFAVSAPAGLTPRADGAEAERAWWARPADLLEDNAEGRSPLYWPTFKMLEALGRCSTVEEVLALQVPQIEWDDREPDPDGPDA